MSDGQSYWADRYLEEAMQAGISIHNREADSLGLSPTKYHVLKQIRDLFDGAKPTLPHYYAVCMEKELKAMFKGVDNGEN